MAIFADFDFKDVHYSRFFFPFCQIFGILWFYPCRTNEKSISLLHKVQLTIYENFKKILVFLSVKRKSGHCGEKSRENHFPSNFQLIISQKLSHRPVIF